MLEISGLKRLYFLLLIRCKAHIHDIIFVLRIFYKSNSFQISPEYSISVNEAAQHTSTLAGERNGSGGWGREEPPGLYS